MPGGRTVALVGATGSGKTTLAALVARLYDPTEGRVLIDGADLREVELGSLRRAIAITGDDPFLFSTTIRENIAYARPDATEQEVREAARRAQAHDFIERLPDGLRHARRRARPDALGRPAPAHRDRARDHREPARS